MRGLLRAGLVALIVAGVGLPVLPAGAATWELALAGIGNQSVRIRDCVTGTDVSVSSDRPWSSPSCGGNLLVSFDGATNAGVVELLPNRDYVFTLVSWGKSFRVRGSTGNTTNNDDMYLFTNSSAPPTRNPFSCFAVPGEQIVDGWPNASCPAPPPPPLSLTLSIDHTTPVGSKTTYFLVATASGGSGTFAFSWSNATMTTGAVTNPSQAARTILNTQSATVTATVTRGTETISKSIKIGGL